MQAPPMQQPDGLKIFQQLQSAQPQIRIQLHRISVPSGAINPPEQMLEQMPAEQQERPQGPPQMQVQQVPLAVALQRAGLTPEDLNNIRKIAEAKLQQEMNRFMEIENSESPSDSDESNDEVVTNSESSQENFKVNTEPASESTNPNILPMGRSGFARSLLKPVNIPFQMMPKEPTENVEKTDQN